MKSYKLIKTYPGCIIPIGSIVKWVQPGYSDYTAKTEKGFYVFPKSHIEDYPEFWKEIKEEYPKIISFRRKFGNREIYKINESGIFTDYKESFGYNYLLEHHLFEIYQVATSPTKIFTVGDKLKYTGTPPQVIRNIEKFSISFITKEVLVHFKEDVMYIDGFKLKLLNLYNSYKEPLFITREGIEMFEGMSCYEVARHNEIYKQPNKFTPLESCRHTYKDDTWIRFYDKELAQDYIDSNKPKFSVKDIEEALKSTDLYYDAMIFVNEFKQKLGI